MENENKLPVYELVLGDEEHDEGVDTISFVEEPAHESNFMFFSKDKEQPKYTFSEDNDKFLVTGAVLIPNQKIYRNVNNEEFEVFFSAETIEQCSNLFFKNSHHDSSNIEHSGISIEGVTVVESWLVEDPKMDKSIALGFSAFPKGSWIATYKVDNKELWSKIKSGEVNGFSIEGYFLPEITKMSVDIDTIGNIERTLKRDLSTDEMYDIIKKMVSEL